MVETTSINLGIERGDTVHTNSGSFTIQAITPTRLVRFEDGTDMGRSAFESLLSSSPTVIVQKNTVPVDSVDSDEYNVAIGKFVESDPKMSAFLTTPVDADEHYLHEDGGAGFAINGDTLVGLFNHTQSSGVGYDLIGESIRHGATNLMYFDTALVDMYRSWGFRETDRARWDEDLAPENWDYKTFGRPDVVWMRR